MKHFLPKLCVIELLFVILPGLGVMAVSLWLLFDHQLYMQSIGAQQTDYYVGTYIILAVGGIMTLVGNTFQSQIRRFRLQIIEFIFKKGFLGCCGAWKESSWMLGTVSLNFEF